MPKSRRVDFDGLREDLRGLLLKGVLTAKEACRYLGISQPTFSRLAARCGDELVIVGRYKTRYALRRMIPDVGSPCPIYRIDRQGETSRFGSLHAVHPRGFCFEPLPGLAEEDRLFADLPYFLDDLRPSGFLGRLIPRKYPELDLPKDIDDWSANDCLKYLTRFGHDLIGDLILGEAAFARYLASTQGAPAIVSPGERRKAYPTRAAEVLQYGDPGSSAGGEQPKFSALVGPEGASVLVKFSPKGEDDVSRRRADLLICEHIGLGIVRRSGHPAAESEIIQSEEQVFLEVRRFDRVGKRGRRGLVSLRVLDAEFGGKSRGWSGIAAELLKQGKIDGDACREIRWRELFGHYIANTDMHAANISLYFEFPRVVGLAPVYDMLPMLYGPQDDQIIAREFRPPTPKSEDADIWDDAWSAGCGFWEAVSSDPRISPSFRGIARQNHRHLRSLAELGRLLPKEKPPLRGA